MSTRRAFSIAALLVPVLSGCVFNRHPHGMPPGQAKKVVVHVHDHHCGHVRAVVVSPGKK